jgi:ferredoxin-thioredoxin reductase catalytic subunit
VGERWPKPCRHVSKSKNDKANKIKCDVLLRKKRRKDGKKEGKVNCSLFLFFDYRVV